MLKRNRLAWSSNYCDQISIEKIPCYLSHLMNALSHKLVQFLELKNIWFNFIIIIPLLSSNNYFT